jgi:hypothetical protein
MPNLDRYQYGCDQGSNRYWKAYIAVMPVLLFFFFATSANAEDPFGRRN